MFENRIDWEHPPSERRPATPSPRRLLFDGMILIAVGTIVRILVGALLAADGVSERGIRQFMLDAGGDAARWLAWGVVAACTLAGLYAIYDLVLIARYHLRAHRGGRP